MVEVIKDMEQNTVPSVDSIVTARVSESALLRLENIFNAQLN